MLDYNYFAICLVKVREDKLPVVVCVRCRFMDLREDRECGRGLKREYAMKSHGGVPKVAL